MKKTTLPNNISAPRADPFRSAPIHCDVGIYGLWYGNNYGSMITYYALNRVIASMGLSCGMISNPLGSEPNPDSLVRSHTLRFARDHYVVSPRYTLADMSRLNAIFDRFVLGSDQMWNIGLSRPYRQSYYLDFAVQDHARIAYATSFGKEIWRGTEEERQTIMQNLRRFDAISVRDDFSRKILQDQFGIDSCVVIDPVFLCPMEDYQQLIRETGNLIALPGSMGNPEADSSVWTERPAPSGSAADPLRPSETPYLFAYILDPDASTGACLTQIAGESGLPVYVAFDEARYVRGEFGRVRDALALTSDRVLCLNDITLQEWLALCSNAQYILTDSFHGACFSILFGKRFIVRKNLKRGGSRFDHLLNTFALTDRMISRSDEFYLKFHADGSMRFSQDYTEVNRILSVERSRCLAWLHDALFLPRKDLPPVTLSAKAVTSVLEPDLCMGCGACVSICPKDALTLRPDRYGYYCPSIQYDTCVNCGLCSSICPALNRPEKKGAPHPECRAFIAADPSILYESSSGGAFPVLAMQMLREGGSVVGAAWGDWPEGGAERPKTLTSDQKDILYTEPEQDRHNMTCRTDALSGFSDSTEEGNAPDRNVGIPDTGKNSAKNQANPGSSQPQQAETPGSRPAQRNSQTGSCAVLLPKAPAEDMPHRESSARSAGEMMVPVRHILVRPGDSAEEELRRLKKSKYLQSYMGDIDREVRRELDAGRRVLFTGCPCQVAGLQAYLGREYERLIAVDLLCGNAPSAMFYRKYLEEDFPQGVQSYQFRSKLHGWNANCVRIIQKDGTIVDRRGGKEDLYQKAYHAHLLCPPHCEKCSYQEVPRYGDLTIGDFWGYSRKDASVDTVKGLSVLLVNSEKGRRFLSSLPQSQIRLMKSVPLEWLGGNGNALPGRHNWASPVRDEFYRLIPEHSFSESVCLALSPESEKAGKEAGAQQERIRKLERELKQERKRREAADQALERVEHSRSYRFARMLSSPLRALRKLRKRLAGK